MLKKKSANAIEIAKQFEKVLYERQLRNIVGYQSQMIKNIRWTKIPS